MFAPRRIGNASRICQAAAILLASPAIAADSATFCGSLGSASIAPDGFGYVVTVVNPLCPGTGWTTGLDVIPLSIDGFAVVVQLWSQPGETPDAIIVLPPPGWMADPAELIVDEHQSGTIRIIPAGLS